MLQCKRVCINQIRDMNIVSDAGTIAGIVILTENGNRPPCPGRCKGKRNDMGFPVVSFSDFVVWISTSSIEMAENNRPPPHCYRKVS